MTDLTDHENDFTVAEQYSATMMSMMMSWKDLGVDPDSMLKCSNCKGLMFDPDNHFDAIPHDECPVDPVTLWYNGSFVKDDVGLGVARHTIRQANQPWNWFITDKLGRTFEMDLISGKFAQPPWTTTE